ncbi:hypothetical protein CTI12_AA253250 [Artemisia annua]|uniref:Uncharacterized protein n=1 Tax=Artemisia annua TaxID=35608 RepID=A0A2U1NKZ2_ARTAN|nr:hypothetical protein CTI12_AA253250 [Artemisia annua]
MKWVILVQFKWTYGSYTTYATKKLCDNTKGNRWVEKIFKKVVEDGAKFCGCATAALIGVGHGAKLLESSPTTTAYLGYLSIAGFFGFSFAQLARSALYVILYVWVQWKLVTIEAEAKAKALLEATTTIEDEVVKTKAEGDAKAIEDEEKHLNQIAKDGVAFTMVGGLGLFYVVDCGTFADALPEVLSFLAAYNVLKKMESIRSHFFNGVDHNARKLSLVKWNNVLASKEKGGRGVSSFYALNRALIFKWVWHFRSQNFSLWSRVIKAIQGEDGKLCKYLIYGFSSNWTDIVRDISFLKNKGIDLLGSKEISWKWRRYDVLGREMERRCSP